MHRLKALLLIPLFALLLMGSVVAAPRAHAAIRPMDSGSCVWYIGKETSKVNSSGYTIHVRIWYLFDSYSGSCGQMKASGWITVPAFHTGGSFTVNLESGGSGISANGSAPSNYNSYAINSAQVFTGVAYVYCVNGAINNFYGGGGGYASIGGPDCWY